eukprot:865611-Heterocapsa_arctica.AAC.1
MKPSMVRRRGATSSGSARRAVAGRHAIASSRKRTDAACHDPEACMARAAPWNPAVRPPPGCRGGIL